MMVNKRRLGRSAAAAALAAAGLAVGVPGPSAAADPGVAVIGPTPSGNTDGVRCIQAALGLPEDGIFGEQTYAAVKDFQRASDLSVDGAVGPLTGDQILQFAPAGCVSVLPSTYSATDSVPTPTPVPADPAVTDPGSNLDIAVRCLAKTAPGSLLKFVRRAGAGSLPETEDLRKLPNAWLDGAKIMKCVLWDNPAPAG